MKYPSASASLSTKAKLQARLYHARQRRLALLLGPPAFSIADQSVNEGASASITVASASDAWTTTVSFSPALPELSFDGADIVGTAPAVDTDTDYVVSVRRSNGHAVSYGTFILTIANV